MGNNLAPMFRSKTLLHFSRSDHNKHTHEYGHFESNAFLCAMILMVLLLMFAYIQHAYIVLGWGTAQHTPNLNPGPIIEQPD